MFPGYDPELAALLSEEVDPARAGCDDCSVSIWTRVQGLLLLCAAVAAGGAMVLI